MIKAIGFDYGGVITKKNFVSFSESYAGIVGVSPEAWRNAHFKHNRKLNVESMDSKEFLSLILKDLGKLDMLEKVFKHQVSQPPEIINSDMINLIDRIRKSGYKTGLLSNTTKQGAADMRALGIDEHFDAFVISAEIGYQKPEKEAYEIFFKELGVAPEELVYVDDTPRSLSRAHEIRFIPLLFSDYDNLLEELARLKVI